MAEHAHELAPHHLPPFLPSADGSDWLMTVMVFTLIVGAVVAGVLYLHLHSIPERLAHKHGRMHFELVAVLGLLALLTHNNIFWVAALILAFVQFPDFRTPIESIANSLRRLAGGGTGPTGAPDHDDEKIDSNVESADEHVAPVTGASATGKAQSSADKNTEQVRQDAHKKEPVHV